MTTHMPGDVRVMREKELSLEGNEITRSVERKEQNASGKD